MIFDLSRYGVWLIVIAFCLHFIWEMTQCQIFYIHLSIPPSAGAMIVATLGDVIITAIGYGATALVFRDVGWGIKNWTWRVMATLELLAIAIGIWVERMGTSMGRWTYTDASPLVPGIGVSAVPILQLLVLLPLTFFLARKATLRVNKPQTRATDI